MAHKKLLTKRLAVDHIAITHDTVETGVDSWVVQDDITVVGIELDVGPTAAIGLIVETGGYSLHAEVTRAADLNKDSALLRVRNNSTWSIAGDNPKPVQSDSIIFPEDARVDIDDGEALNLIFSAQSIMATLDTLTAFANANILYYNR